MSRKFFLPLLLTLVASAPAFGQVTVSGTSTPGTFITTGAPFTDTITIGAVDSLVIANAECDLDISHTFQADLDLILSSTAGGVTVELTTDNGGGGDDVLVTFSSVGGPFDGFNLAGGATMQAEGPGAMSDFHGGDSADDWNLSVTDDAGGDDGTLNSWTMRLSDTAGPPVNNDCAGAFNAPDGSTNGFDTTAATESGLAGTCLFGPQVDVWYVHNSSFDGDTLFSLSNSSYDTTMTIYDGTTGCPIDQTTEIGCDDDGGAGATSEINLATVSGTTYYIQCAGFNGGTGAGELTVTAGIPPANDLCDNAQNVGAGTTAYSSLFATDSAFAHSCQSNSGADVWFSHTACGDGDFTFSLVGSSYDTVLSVYDATTGCPIDDTTELGCDDDGGGSLTSELTLTGQLAGASYLIRVSGFNGQSGDGTLTLSNTGAPSNDTCATPIALVGNDGTAFNNGGCTSQSGDNPGCGSTFTDPFDLWYTYEATCDGDLTIDTNGSLFDTRLAIWDACGGAVVACDDDGGIGTQSLILLPAVTAGTVFLIQVGGFAGSQGDGVLNTFCGDPDIDPVTGVTCEASAGGSVDVSWTNSVVDVYDSIEILVDGVVDQTLAGTDMVATVTGLADFASVEICVNPILAGTTSIQSCCTVTIPGDFTGLVVIVDGDFGGLDSQAAVEAALIADGASPITVGSILDGVGTPAELFVLNGTFPNNTAMSTDEGQAIADAQAAGTPVFMSSGDGWGFDAPTAYNDGDGIDNETALDGDDSFLGGIGAGEFATFDFVYTQEAVGIDYQDQIDPITDLSTTPDLYGTAASIAWSDDGTGGDLTGYTTGVFYDADGAGNALNTSWEFAGYGGDQNALMTAMRGALAGGPPPGPEFVRGDTNADGLFNIADMINLLGVLFPSGAPTNFPCDDAGDTNDDGLLNIADAINGLGVLFPSGAPAGIPAPFGACGEDLTADALGCDSFPACP